MSQNSTESAACTTYNIGPNYICNNHGTCNQQGQCICNSGWSSRGDFQVEYYTDCDISIMFVQVGSIILIVSATIALFIATWNVVHFRDFKSSTLILPKNLITIFYLLASIMGIVYGSFRLADPIDNIIGSAVGPSLGMSGFMVFTFSGWALLSVIFNEFLSNASRVFSTKARERISNFNVTIQRIWWKVSLFSLLIPIFTAIANTESQLADTMSICVLAVCTFEVEMIAGMLIVVLGSFNREFGIYIISAINVPPGLPTIRFRTRVLYYICMFFFVTVGPAMITIAAIPYLRRKFTYFVILFMICCIYPTIIVLIMLVKAKPRISPYSESSRASQSVANPSTGVAAERSMSLLFSIEFSSRKFLRRSSSVVNFFMKQKSNRQHHDEQSKHLTKQNSNSDMRPDEHKCERLEPLPV